MPTPIVIRDPALHNKRPDPTSALGIDTVSPAIESFVKRSGVVVPSRNAANDATSPQHHMDDISTSPRLLGYVFSFISSAVSMISSTVFYNRGIAVASTATIEEYGESMGVTFSSDELAGLDKRINGMTQVYDLYFGSGGIIVQQWKVFAAIAISALLTTITLFILIAHFDSFCFPKQFRRFFRDGSKSERNLILILIVLSVFALHASTSKFSVGEAQANVFFSTWTNFVSCAMNYEVWRKGSGRKHSFQNIMFDMRRRHWFILSIFATITFISTIDFFIHNNFVKSQQSLECLDVSLTNKWIWMTLASAILCWGVVLVHHYKQTGIFVRVLEIAVALTHVIGYGIVVATMTGGKQVNCPSNLYFGTWTTFFTSIWIFSSTIKRYGRPLVDGNEDDNDQNKN